jgi:hypothetical protein
MAPSASSETRNPEFPSSLYFISSSSISLDSLSYRSQAAGSAITGFFWGPDFPPLSFPVFFVCGLFLVVSLGFMGDTLPGLNSSVQNIFLIGSIAVRY